MMKFILCVLICLLSYCFLFSTEYLDQPYTNRLSFGVGFSGGLNFHTANFKGVDFPNIPSCCPRFETGFGLNYNFGAFLTVPINSVFSLQMNANYSNLGARLTKIEKEYVSTPQLEGVWGEFEHSIEGTFNSLAAELSIAYNLTPKFRIHLGPTIDYLLKYNYEQKEEIVSPSYGVFAIERTRVRNHYQGEVPNVNQLILGVGIGVNYWLPMNQSSTFFLIPNASVRFRINDLASNSEWKAFTFSAGLNFVLAPRKIKRIPPPIAPPIMPPLPDYPVPPSAPYLEASIEAVSLDENGRELPVTVLKVEEFLSTQTHPILGYVFFEENSAEIPKRYKLLNTAETKDFSARKLYGYNTLEIYHNMLNIIGKRVLQFPQSELTIVGCNSDQGTEKGNLELSRRRAEAVRNYFVNVWNIDPERIKIEARNLPENPSNPNDPDGIAENRRVEIYSNIPQILEPLVVEDTLREVNPPKFRFKPQVKTQIGVESWQLVTMQSQGIVKIFEGQGEIPKVIEWDVALEQRNVPKLDEPLKYKLVVVDKDNKRWESRTQELPVEVQTIQKKIFERVADKQIDRFSLILFGFGQFTITGDNLKIAQLAKRRIKPNSLVRIEGYTDRIGNETTNLELSLRRAQETAKVLGIDPRYARGLGETILLYDNDLPEGRFYCRTVNIEIVTPIE